MVLKWWQDPCNCISNDGYTFKSWRELFKLKWNYDDEEPNFCLSFLCCPCSCIGLSLFLPCVACKEYQIYQTTKDILIIEQPVGYHSITQDSSTKYEEQTSAFQENDTRDESMYESLYYYKKSKPIPIFGKRPKTKLTLI